MANINIAEILKDCPEGMKLDCTLFEGLEFDGIVDNEYLPIRCRIKNPDGGYTVYYFTKYGCWLDVDFAKCVIFPKGKTTWEGFHRPFKDGDILSNGICICIYNGNESKNYYGLYVGVGHIDYPNYFIFSTQNSYFTKKNAHLATEEEKEKLYQAIKDNGYKWNAETNTLERLIEPKFKVGDRVKRKNVNYTHIVTIVGIDGEYYGCVNEDGQYSNIFIESQNNYELIPNKFDINTLVPFESRVLVRNSDSGFWKPAFWGIYESEKSNEHQYRNYLTTEGFVRHCIPYNDETKHLIGKTSDCPEYYKIGEE